MGLDIGGNPITYSGGALVVQTATAVGMLSTGGVLRPQQTQFLAIGDQAISWTNLGNGWTKMAFPTTRVNVNTCYDTVNSRFTAPVDGMYFFQASTYLLKDGANASYYWHPLFAVNGNVAGRVVSSNAVPNYRLRGHGVTIAAYLDGHIQQVYKLLAGDYVENYVFSNGSPLNRYHPPYQQFTGFLLG